MGEDGELQGEALGLDIGRARPAGEARSEAAVDLAGHESGRSALGGRHRESKEEGPGQGPGAAARASAAERERE